MIAALLSSVLSVAQADTLVILYGPDSKTQEIEGKVPENTEFLTWPELQAFNLTFGSVSNVKGCLSKPVTLADLQTSLKNAEKAVDYLETKNSIGHVRQIQNNLVCANEPVSTELLVRSSFIAGVAYNYDDNLELARRNWQQALKFDRNLKWDEGIEPSGKPAFEEVRLNLESQASTRLVFLPDDAQLTVDGKNLTSGSDVVAGEHFVQHDALGHQGYRFTTEMGADAYIVSFADFPAELEAVMSDPVKSSELLRGLLLVQDKTDIRVVTETEYWYLPMGTSKWKSQPLKNPLKTAVAVSETPVKAPETPDIAVVPAEQAVANSNIAKVSLNKPLVYAGAGAAAVGLVSLVVSQQQYRKFNSYDSTAALEDVQDTYNLQRRAWAVGLGMTVVGGGLAIGGTF